MSLLIAVIAHPALQHVLATQFTQAQASAEQNGCHAELASGFKAPHLSHQNFYMKLPKYSEIWSVSQVNYLKVQAAVSGISQAKDCKLGSSKPAHRQVLQLSEWMKQISKSLCHLKDYRQKMTKEPTCASSSSPPVDCSFNQVCLEFARNSPKPPAETTRMTSEGAGRLGSNPPQPTCGAAAQPSCDLLIRQLFTVEIIQWRHLRFQPTGPHVLRKKKKKHPLGLGMVRKASQYSNHLKQKNATRLSAARPAWGSWPALRHFQSHCRRGLWPELWKSAGSLDAKDFLSASEHVTNSSNKYQENPQTSANKPKTINQLSTNCQKKSVLHISVTKAPCLLCSLHRTDPPPTCGIGLSTRCAARGQIAMLNTQHNLSIHENMCRNRVDKNNNFNKHFTYTQWTAI